MFYKRKGINKGRKSFDNLALKTFGKMKNNYSDASNNTACCMVSLINAICLFYESSSSVT